MSRAIFCLPLLASAALAEESLSLSDAIARAIASHPQLAVAVARIGAAEGLRRQAGLSPNPRLILQLENVRAWDRPAFRLTHDSDDYAFLSQPIETGKKRERRVELAASGVRRARLERQLLSSQVAVRAGTAYWAAAGAYRIRDLLQQELANFEKIVQYSRDRVREGAMPEVNLLRVQLERDRLAVSAETAVREADRAAIALAREMGRTEFAAIVPADSIETLATVEDADVRQALDRRPEMQLAREAIEHAHANVRLQQANASPDVEAQLGYKRTLGYDTIYSAIQIPLPVRNRNQGQIAAAEAEVRAAQAALTATEAQVRADVAGAQAEFEAWRRLVSGTVRPMQDQASEISRLAEGVYREGAFDLLRLLDAERARLETRVLYMRSLAEYQQSVINLRHAAGSLP